jgi:hypothetical protein
VQYTFPGDINPFIDTGIFIKADGSRALSSDWDIGAGRKILTEKIQARDEAGLALGDHLGNGILVVDGMVGIGALLPGTSLSLSATQEISAAGYFYGFNSQSYASGVVASGFAALIGNNLFLTNNANKSGSATLLLIGAQCRVNNTVGYLASSTLGGTFSTYNTHTSGVMDSTTGGNFGVTFNGPGGVITDVTGGAFYCTITAGSTTTVKAASFSLAGNGTIAHGYGIYIGTIKGTEKWSLWANDATAPSYFAGNVGLAITPTARLHINSPAGQDALKIATGQGGDISIDEWGNLHFSHNGLGARYDSNLGQVSFNNANDLYLSSGWGSASAANILLIPSSTGKIGLLTNAPVSPVDINADTMRLRTARTPASAAASGNQGEICWDSSFIYVCVAANTWKRATLNSW